MSSDNRKTNIGAGRHGSPNKPTDVRVAVINTLIAIQQGQSLSSLLDPLLNGLNGEDRGFAHALLLTTLRHWHATGRLLDSLADNPIEELAVRTTIQLGITQLLYLHVADHAAIHETVEAIKKIDLARASGLINAILRKVAKNTNKFRKKCNKNHSLPNWLAQQLKTDWREQYDGLTQGLRQPAPMFLRVNTLETTAQDYLNELTAAEIEADIINLVTAVATATESALAPKTLTIKQDAVRLTDSLSVSQLPDFEEGIASVQDAHAQLAAPIIHKVVKQAWQQRNEESNTTCRKLRLLDACAAPGGKLAHWLELIDSPQASMTNEDETFHVEQTQALIPSISLTAIDNEPQRITRIFENLERLQLPRTMSKRDLELEIVCADATSWQAKLEASDANESDDLSDGSGFDAILLDAPCTATGVIRRHPDITLLRNEEDVAQTVELQAEILDNLWRQLNKGGYLLYITCSILKAENVEQMQTFLKHHGDAIAVAFDDEGCNWGTAQAIGRQCLPVYQDEDSLGGDGFYFALLQKSE